MTPLRDVPHVPASPVTRLTTPHPPSSPIVPRGFGLLDLVVLLFLLALTLTATAGYVVNANNGSSRTRCVSNLRQIGQSIQTYANENRGAFPRTTFDLSDDPFPTEYTGVKAPDPFGPGGPWPNDVTAPLYLLLRTGGITPDVFTCPMSTATGSAGKVEGFSNFPGRANLSYGYTNPYPSAAARKLGFKLYWTLNSDFAVAADMGRGPHVGTVPANAPRQLMMWANAPAHRGDGQNVLYADGRVDWNATIFCGSLRPVAGAPRDNVYAYGADLTATAPSAGIVGAPQDQYDSVILPTADMGPQPGPLPPPGPAPTMSRQTLIAVAGGLLAAIVIAVLVVLLRARRLEGDTPPPPVA